MEKVIFQGDIDEIEDCAFADLGNLEEVEFHGKCNRIGCLAFASCGFSLQENINIPEGCICDKVVQDGTIFGPFGAALED